MDSDAQIDLLLYQGVLVEAQNNLHVSIRAFVRVERRCDFNPLISVCIAECDESI